MKSYATCLRLPPEYIEWLRFIASARSINEPNFSYVDLIRETIFERWPLPVGGYNKLDVSIASGIVYNKESNE